MKSKQYFQYTVLKRSIFMLYTEMYHMQSRVLCIRELLYSQNRWWSGINKQNVFLEAGAYFHAIKYGRLPISPLNTTWFYFYYYIHVTTLLSSPSSISADN